MNARAVTAILSAVVTMVGAVITAIESSEE
jgi:hypothetical protein